MFNLGKYMRLYLEIKQIQKDFMKVTKKKHIVGILAVGTILAGLCICSIGFNKGSYCRNELYGYIGS